MAATKPTPPASRTTTPTRPKPTPPGYTPPTQPTPSIYGWLYSTPVQTTIGRTMGGRITPDLGDDEFTSARQIVAAYLDQLGLGALANWAFERITATDALDPNRIMLEIRQTPEYRYRFAGNFARQERGLNVLSEAEYLALEDRYAQIMREAGMPRGFYDNPADYARFIGDDVSPDELSWRVQEGIVGAQQADPEVRRQLRAMYGVSDQDLVAYFLDPERTLPLLIRQFTAAKVGAEAVNTGFGSLTAAEAEGVGAQGITQQQARSGFGALAADAALFRALDQGETPLTREEQLAAAFQNDTAAQARIEQTRRRRLRQFEGPGDFARTREGQTGLGSAV